MPASRKPVDEALAMAGVVRPKAITPSINHSGAGSDEQIVDLWLGRYDSPHTRRAYDLDAERFLEYLEDVERPPAGLREVTVAHVIGYIKHLKTECSAATQARRASSLKSLLSFGHQTGYLQFNVGAAIKAPKIFDLLHERILSVDQVRGLIAGARPGRDRALVKFLYFSGARIAEATALEWKHVRDRDGILRVTLYGKGKKVRHVPLPSLLVSDFEALQKLRLGSHVFESCYGNALDQKEAWRIIRRAAEAAHIEAPVSPHWLRHAHASHAMARGAHPKVVQETLGHSSLSTTGRYAHIDNTESSGLFLSL